LNFTARDAADKGFKCIIIHDACAADTEEHHNAAIITYRDVYGSDYTTDEVIEELEENL
jgi:nicotinamidase-related amidase